MAITRPGTSGAAERRYAEAAVARSLTSADGRAFDARALPMMDEATRAACREVADRLEAATDDMAAAMAAAVFREVPVYHAVAGDQDVQRTVLSHSVDHVHAVA